MAQQPKVFTSEDFTTKFGELKKLIMICGGGNGGRARFKGFKIVDTVKEYIDTAVDRFRKNQTGQAVHYLEEAEKCLLNMERAYARNSIEKFFNPIMHQLPKLDSDINDSIGKKYREYVEIVNLLKTSPSGVDMNEVSKRYWALHDRIHSAPAEQQARIRNREQRAEAAAREESRKTLEDLGRKERERAEAARAAQKEADARSEARRNELADQLMGELAEVF